MAWRLLIPKIWRAVTWQHRPNLRAPRPPFPYTVRPNMRHSPCDWIVPLETPGALLEGLRCLTASRPLQTRKEFQGKTMSSFMLKTDLRLSEDDGQNVFWRRLRLDGNLIRGHCWNLDRTW